MATWRLRRIWRLRRESEDLGKPFNTSDYETSQALANNTTWRQELLFAIAVPLLLLMVIGCIVLAGLALLELLH